MFASHARTVARAAAGTSLTAAAFAIAAFGVVAIANTDDNLEAGGNVCHSYDYSTQVFYDCV